MKKLILVFALLLPVLIIAQTGDTLSNRINPDHYQIIQHDQQKTSLDAPVINRYLVNNIYNMAKVRADYGANESSIFDTNSDGQFNTLDLLQWLPALDVVFPEPALVASLFDRLELDQFTFGEGNQFLTPIDPTGEIQLAIVHKKFFGDDLGKPNGSWDLAHFTLEILYKDGRRTVHTFLRR